MGKINIELPPVNMTKEVMQELEEKGLVINLRPGQHDIESPIGETTWKLLYEPEENYGPHRLIVVCVNRQEFTAFGTHPDGEEFLLIGNKETQPMYLAIALISKEELEMKINEETLTSEDFVLLRVRYNDPEVSFFVMCPDVPHGEAIVDKGKIAASFYVTESRDLPLEITDWKNYKISIKG